MTIKKVMLAPSQVVTDEQLGGLMPKLLSKKLDGIRCYVHPELGPVTRTLKPIPNDYIRNELNKPEYHGLDGELLTYSNNGKHAVMDDFNTVSGNCRRKKGEPYFMFHVFDDTTNLDAPFIQRTASAQSRAERGRLEHVKYVKHYRVVTGAEARRICRSWIDLGYEGGMLRDAGGIYKQGRATFKQELLLKFKLFERAEGTINGWKEAVYGDTEENRELCQVGKGMGMLGAWVLASDFGEVECIGGTHEQRKQWWSDRLNYQGRLVTFQYQPEPGGRRDFKPRFPTFVGFRMKEDV